MALQDLLEKGLSIARKLGDVAGNAFNTLYTTDIQVIAKYVLILLVAVLLILGLRLLREEVEEYRDRKKSEHGKMPWYLRDWVLFSVIGLVVLVTYAVIFRLVR